MIIDSSYIIDVVYMNAIVHCLFNSIYLESPTVAHAVIAVLQRTTSTEPTPECGGVW